MKILFPEITQETPRIFFFQKFTMDVCQEENTERIFGQWRAASVSSLAIIFFYHEERDHMNFMESNYIGDKRELKFVQLLRYVKQLLSKFFWSL